MENIKVPWACQGNVNGPSPSLVGVHTSFPGPSEDTDMTVSTTWGPKCGGLTTQCAQSSLQLQHLEEFVTGFSTLATPPASFTVEQGANKAKVWLAFAVAWRPKPALAQGVVGRTNSRDKYHYHTKISLACDEPALRHLEALLYFRK